METISTASFCFGAFYGFITAGVIGLIANQIRIARVERNRQNLALDNLPDSVHPNLTSAGIFWFSTQATFRLVGWGVLLLGFIGLTTAGVFYIVA